MSIVYDIIIAVLYMTGLCAIGHEILKRSGFNFSSTGEKVVLSFALGSGLFGIFIFLFGVFFGTSGYRFFRFVFILILVIPLGLRFYKEIIVAIKVLLSEAKADSFKLILLAFMVFFLVLNSFVSLAPITSMDSLNYHFLLPKTYIEAGRIIHLKGFLYAHLQQLNEMNNLFLMKIWSDTCAALFNSFFALMLSLATFSLSKKYFRNGSALLAAAIVLCSTLVTWEATGGFVELSLAFYCTAGFLAFVLFEYKKESKYLILSGVFFGFALSTKLVAVNFLSIFTLIMLYGLYRERNLSKSSKHLLKWAAFIFLAGSPWYLFNYIKTGNPFFPFFYSIFGGEGWSESANAALKGVNVFYGYGSSWLHFLGLPFNITLRGIAYDHGELLGPLFLTFIPIALIKLRKEKSVQTLAVFSVLFSLIWFFSTKQARFLMPILPMLAVLASAGISELFKENRFRFLSKATVILFFVFSLSMSGFFAKRFVKVVMGFETKSEFLKKTVPGHRFIEWMNYNLDKNKDKVFFLGYGPYYLDIPFMFGTNPIQGSIDYMNDPPDMLIKKLREEGITHIYRYMWSVDAKLIKKHGTVETKDNWGKFSEKYLEIIYRGKNKISSSRALGGEDSEEIGIVYRIK